MARRVVERGQADRNAGKVLVVEGEKVRLSRTDEGALRLDLEGMERAFVLMSGRLYAREDAGRERVAETKRGAPAVMGMEEQEPKPKPMRD